MFSLASLVFALLAALTALSVTAVASPLLARDDGTECTREGFPLWHLAQDSDAANVGDLKSHPAWGKKMSTPCECATSVRNVAGPQAPLFVWNSGEPVSSFATARCRGLC